jgi:hypothetical protein
LECLDVDPVLLPSGGEPVLDQILVRNERNHDSAKRDFEPPWVCRCELHTRDAGDYLQPNRFDTQAYDVVTSSKELGHEVWQIESKCTASRHESAGVFCCRINENVEIASIAGMAVNSDGVPANDEVANAMNV